MIVSIIVAVDQKHAIGHENKLLYWLPDDLKRFKALTTGHTIVMGRRTFESLPKGALPNRRNIVLSRTGFSAPGIEVYSSLPAALEACAHDEEVYVIGGSSVYVQALPIADRLYLTCVDDVAKEADAFFPSIQSGEWIETGRAHHTVDEKHNIAFDFVDLKRK